MSAVFISDILNTKRMLNNVEIDNSFTSCFVILQTDLSNFIFVDIYGNIPR